MIFPIKNKEIETLNYCPVCEGKEFKGISKVNLENENFTILSTDFCQQCGVVFRQTRPTPGWLKKSWQIRDLHQNNETIAPIFNEQLEQRRYLRYSNLAQALEQIINVNDKKILDIGTGPGTGLKAFHDRSWIVTGLEPDPIRAKIGREMYGLNIIESTLEEYVGNNHNYDVVTIIHALEHFHSPLSFLKDVVRLVKEEGYVYIEVPDVMNFVSWTDSLYLEHLLNFSQENLTLLAKRAGLQPHYRFFPKTKPDGVIHLGILFQKKSHEYEFSSHKIEVITNLSRFYEQISQNYMMGLPLAPSNDEIQFVVPEINDLRSIFKSQQKHLVYSKSEQKFIFTKSLPASSPTLTSTLTKRLVNLTNLPLKVLPRKIAAKAMSKLTVPKRFADTKNKNLQEKDSLVLRFEKFS